MTTSVSGEPDGVKRIWRKELYLIQEPRRDVRTSENISRGRLRRPEACSWKMCSWADLDVLDPRAQLCVWPWWKGLLVNERSGTIWPHRRVGEAFFFFLLLRNNRPSAVLLERHTWHSRRWRLPTSSDVNGHQQTTGHVYRADILTPVIFFSCLISDCTVLIFFGNLYLIFLLG